MKTSKLWGLFTFTLILLSSFFAQALSVKSLSLNQIVGLSDVVFRGELVEVSLSDDLYESGQLVKYYTFRVEECLKGNCGEQVVFKQLALGPKGLPEYQMNKEYVLFLPRASERTGLVAPVGIWQGRYELERQQNSLVVPALKKKSSALKTLGLSGKGITDSGTSYEAFKQDILNQL
jgi:hypothetical protein